jgi:desert hedgehog
LRGEKVQSKVNYTIECPAECLSQLAGPVTIYNSFLHSHLTGKQMWTNLYRDGEDVKTIEGTAFWSNGNQRPTLFEKTELRPGDKLVIGANYDTSKRDASGDEPVVWGLGTKDEMLMSFLFVYPRPARKGGAGFLNYCGFGALNASVCTDGLTLEPGVDVLDGAPLKIGDGDDPGFSTEFGGAAQCQVAGKSDDAAGKKKSKDDNSCFPADAVVQLESGATKRMDELAVGDRVLVAEGTYDTVFMFTHKVSDGASRAFVRLTTDSGASITATPGHYIFVAGRGMVAASTVCVGDGLRLGAGGVAAVVRAEGVVGRGLYNPQTVHGEIVVGGIVASTYTRSVDATIAHAVLAPLRALYRATGISLTALESGAPAAAQAGWMPRGRPLADEL